MKFVAVHTVLVMSFLATSAHAFQNIDKKPVTTSSSTMLNLNANANLIVDTPPLKSVAPRKICLMVEPTPFTHISGYANRFNEMLKYLSKAGDKVSILTTDDVRTGVGNGNKEDNNTNKELPTEAFGFPIEHTQGFNFSLYSEITLTVDLPEMKGSRIMEKFKPDVIHATSPGFMLVAALLYSRIFKIPILLSYHTHLPVYARNYLGFIPGIERFAWWLIRLAHTRADYTLVTSPQIKEEFDAEGVPRVGVWRKGIDTVRFQPSFKDAEFRNMLTDGNPDDFLMIYAGRLGAEKRLADIKPMLEKLGPNTRLAFVGKGPQKEELEEMFQGTNTVFTGMLTGDDLSKAFASADAFIMPSDSETLGFVVLESMASGVPVVGAKAGGVQDIIDDGKNGFLVEPGNTEKYVECLRKLKDDKDFRVQMASSARAEAERWGWEAATSVLRNVQYERAMVNFHSRALGGFGKPTVDVVRQTLLQRLRLRLRMILQRIGFRKRANSSSQEPATA